MLCECDGKRHIEACSKLLLALPEDFPPECRDEILTVMDQHAVEKQIWNAPEVTSDILG